MSKTKGQMLTCDRCGQRVFLELIDIRDMGFYHVDKFEDPPIGWSENDIVGDLCPTCARKWDKTVDDFKKVIRNEDKSN